MAEPKIAIVGAGIGGLATAAALLQANFSVTVFEQAHHFSRVGAGINLTPNSIKALDGLGLGQAVCALGFQAQHRVSRLWDTGEVTSNLSLNEGGLHKYGAPQVTIHRAELLTILEQSVDAACIQFNKKLMRLQQDPSGVTLEFTDGHQERFDAVIGADGIHSCVREQLAGGESPEFSGMVAFRSVIDVKRLPKRDYRALTKWWGPNSTSQLFTFLIDEKESELFVFATAPLPDWPHESWSIKAQKEELLGLYAHYCSEATSILEHCDDILKTAMYVRQPLQSWSFERVALLGDACHSMLPFMAHGAAMGLVDAVVLARCLSMMKGHDVCSALKRYEHLRLSRASKIQLASAQNDWLRNDSNAEWVYGYNPWQIEI